MSNSYGAPPPDPRINALGVQPYAPMGGMNPQAIQAAYIKKLLEKQQGGGGGGQQQPIRSWTQVAAGIADTLADQMQLSRLMSGAKAGVATEAELMFPGEGGHATPDGADAPGAFSGAPGGAPAAPVSQAVPGGQGGAPGQGPNDGTLIPAMSLSSRAETSKTGTEALTNISPDSAGSKSYGPWGLNSKTGSAAQFVQANPHLGITAQPGTAEFDQQWRAAAQHDPDAMLQAHQDWYKSRYLDPVGSKLIQAGVNPQIAQDPRVQAYMADRTLQMGSVGQNRVLAAARGATDPASFIHAVSMSDHASIGGDFRTYLSSYPTHTKGLGNRIDWRQGASLVIGGQSPGQGGGSAMAFNGQPSAGNAMPPMPGGAPAPQMGAPSPGGTPQVGAPEASPGAPGGTIGQSGNFLPESTVQRPPIMSREQAKQAYMAAAMRGDTAGAKQIHDDYMAQFKPQQFAVPGGMVHVSPTVNPQTGRRDQHFVPTLEKGTEKLPGGIERPYVYTVSPTGQGGTRVPITSPQTQGQPQGGAPAINELPENPTPGQAQEFARKGAVLQKGQEEQQAADVKMYGGLHAGITGAADNAAHQAQNIALLKEAAPGAYTGTGSNISLGLNRLASKFGINATGAAPRELFNQVAARVLADQFSGMRNLSAEEGSAASRVFKSMLDIEEKANITHEDTLEGVQAKLNMLEQAGKQAMRWGDKADDYKEQHGKLGPGFMKELRKDIAETRFEGIVPKENGAQEGAATRSIGGKTYYQRNGKWFTE